MPVAFVFGRESINPLFSASVLTGLSVEMMILGYCYHKRFSKCGKKLIILYHYILALKASLMRAVFQLGQ